jgi:hypothetical protein
VIAVGVAAGLPGCNGDPVKSVTTEENLLATPKPPERRYPFREGLEGGLNPADYQNRVPLQAVDPACATKVQDPPGIVVRTTGNLVGGLKYNTRKRGTGNAAETNGGNVALGGVWKDATIGWYDLHRFKFQVEISFVGPLADAFYGQMVTDPVALDATEKDVEFKDDTPANDWIGKEWSLAPGETKNDAAVVEVAGQTVRWIDAPGGTAFTVANKKMYFLFYAGACKKLTHVKIFKIEYPENETPKMTELTAAQLDAEVRNFSFRR